MPMLAMSFGNSVQHVADEQVMIGVALRSKADLAGVRSSRISALQEPHQQSSWFVRFKFFYEEFFLFFFSGFFCGYLLVWCFRGFADGQPTENGRYYFVVSLTVFRGFADGNSWFR
jgi:hypothetical protein